MKGTKISTNYFPYILQIVEENLLEVKFIFGLDFDVKFILASPAQNDNHPEAMDIFVKINSIKIIDQDRFLKYYGTRPPITKDNDLIMFVDYYYFNKKPLFFNSIPLHVHFEDDFIGKIKWYCTPLYKNPNF